MDPNQEPAEAATTGTRPESRLDKIRKSKTLKAVLTVTFAVGMLMLVGCCSPLKGPIKRIFGGDSKSEPTPPTGVTIPGSPDPEVELPRIVKDASTSTLVADGVSTKLTADYSFVTVAGPGTPMAGRPTEITIQPGSRPPSSRSRTSTTGWSASRSRRAYSHG